MQKLLAGDLAGFLQGGENVFYYGGPGLRYFRALEHLVFGESYLGYLSLVLLLPFLCYWLVRPLPAADAGRSPAVRVHRHPARRPVRHDISSNTRNGPAAALPIRRPIFFSSPASAAYRLGRPDRTKNSLPAFFAALLFALAIFMKPIVAPAAAVLLGGAGLAALTQRQWPRLAGLCIGVLPVFSMALHNWVFGHVFVLFSANADDSIC